MSAYSNAVDKSPTNIETAAPEHLPIKAITPYGPGGGSSRVRVFDWLNHCQISCAVVSLSSSGRSDPGSKRQLIKNHARAVAALRNPGTTIVHREPSLIGQTSVRPGANTRVIYDLDDAIYLSAYNPKGRVKRAERIARHADTIVAGNAEIANWAERLCQDIRVIPSCVEPDLYTTKKSYRIGPTPSAVWVGSHTSEAYLQSIAPHLNELHARIGFELTIIGNGKLGTFNRPYVKRVEWSEEVVHRTLHDYDFGIMPLPNNSFTRGKCGYKILQYGSAGLPAIASPVGVNTEIVSDTWLKPIEPADWIDAIVQLCELSDFDRENLGKRLSQHVKDNFSFSANRPDWMSAIWCQ